MRKALFLIAGAALAGHMAAAAAQSGFSSLEERMSGKEFEAAGLDKLSAEELEMLNEWIRANAVSSGDDVSLETRQQIRREVEAEAQRRAEGERTEYTATIPGHFTGWTGRTVFELDNGEVWRQTTGGSYRVSMDDPTVVIYPGSFGSWRLRLEETGPSIGIERVK